MPSPGDFAGPIHQDGFGEARAKQLMNAAAFVEQQFHAAGAPSGQASPALIKPSAGKLGLGGPLGGRSGGGNFGTGEFAEAGNTTPARMKMIAERQDIAEWPSFAATQAKSAAQRMGVYFERARPLRVPPRCTRALDDRATPGSNIPLSA